MRFCKIKYFVFLKVNHPTVYQIVLDVTKSDQSQVKISSDVPVIPLYYSMVAAKNAQCEQGIFLIIRLHGVPHCTQIPIICILGLTRPSLHWYNVIRFSRVNFAGSSEIY